MLSQEEEHIFELTLRGLHFRLVVPIQLADSQRQTPEPTAQPLVHVDEDFRASLLFHGVLVTSFAK
jgi:hypothetical protein